MGFLGMVNITTMGVGGTATTKTTRFITKVNQSRRPKSMPTRRLDLLKLGAGTIDQAVASNTDIEWMPLGVFALVHEEDGEPTFFMQLQIAKDGTISGTYVNSAKDTSQTIQGSVDKESQRAAWTVGDNPNTVIETGLYNLTKDETPALIHFGTEKTQEWLLVRMDDPDADGGS